MAAQNPPVNLFDGLDDVTATLILQMQLDEVSGRLAQEEQFAIRRGTTLSDFGRTLLVQESELVRSLDNIRDRQRDWGVQTGVARDFGANRSGSAARQQPQAEQRRVFARDDGGQPPRGTMPDVAARIASQNLRRPYPTDQRVVASSSRTTPLGFEGCSSMAQPGPATSFRAPPSDVNPSRPMFSYGYAPSSQAPLQIGTPRPKFEPNAPYSPPSPPLLPLGSRSVAQPGHATFSRAPPSDLSTSRPMLSYGTPTSSQAPPWNGTPRPTFEPNAARSSGFARAEPSLTRRLEEMQLEPSKSGTSNATNTATEHSTSGKGKANNSGNTNTDKQEERNTARRLAKDRLHARHPQVNTGSSTHTAIDGPANTGTCVICMEELPLTKLVAMTCEHKYCNDCLAKVVQNAIVEEALFPPRCCRLPFDMDSIKQFIPLEVNETFCKKKIEYETQNRIYCSNRACSVFLDPATIEGDSAFCSQCLTSTCTICKAKSHTGDCPEDEGTQQLLELANDQGWRRCPSCQRVVELSFGCNHITCSCKAEWCYICGTPWRNCACPQWSEERLLLRATERVDRRQVYDQLRLNARAMARARAEEVDAARQALRENHDCEHPDWDKVDGLSHCDLCRRFCASYINRCVQCDLQVCYACKLNRLN